MKMQNTIRLLQKRHLILRQVFWLTGTHKAQSNYEMHNNDVFTKLQLSWMHKHDMCTKFTLPMPPSEEPGFHVSSGVGYMEEIDSSSTNSRLQSLIHAEDDELMRFLHECKHQREVLNVFESNKDSMLPSHLIHSVMLLWNFTGGSSTIVEKLLNEKVFAEFLDVLRLHIAGMSSDQLSCCYLYLGKMGVENSNKVMQELLLKSLDVVESDDQIPLPALSRLILAINSCRDFHIASVCRNFLPHITSHIERCNSAEEARLLAICIVNLHQLTSHHILDAFKAKVTELILNSTINSVHLKSVLKIINILNMPYWAPSNLRLQRDLMMLTRSHIKDLSETNLRSLFKIFQSQMEPAGITGELLKSAERKLKEKPTPDMIACYVQFAEPHKREPLIVLLKELMASEQNWHLLNASAHFFIALRGLKISDIKICDAYWSGVVREIDANASDETQLRFLRYCNWYMNFNNNLGGTYRHLDLERRLSHWAMNMIERDIAGLIPSKFARLAAFVLGYGHTNQCHTKFPNIVVSKIISMANQFSIMDCFYMTRGLQIALEMRFRQYNPPPLTSQLAIMENVFAECTQRHLNQDNLSPSEINAIVRALNNRKSSKRSQIYHKALSKYKEIDCNALTSRTIRDIAYNLNTSNYIVPEVLEAMFKYIEENHEHVMGDTVEKVLTSAYSLGYSPKSTTVLEYAAQILLRDFELMSGLSLVQACLALCYYKSIPEELISKVFCTEFIKRIEEEIQMCYSKATYPDRVLNLVMQLNRTVCLDFPEANVPWFQQNYIEAQMSNKPIPKTRFTEDVKNFLKSVLKDESYFRCNHVTPYGYRIDFVIHFDKNNKPIPAPEETAMLDRITKVAILLLKLDSFCENDLTSMRGHEALRMKHLEMMGYKVLHINMNDWNSKYMNAPTAKANYLKCLLKISN